MKTKPSKFYHPYCHLLNGERLHFLLIKARVVSAQIRNALTKVVKDTLGEKFFDTMCLYQVFGETDLILRIWASKLNIKKLLDGLRACSEVESVQPLLIRTMKTWYQEQIEKNTDWNEDLLSQQFEGIVNHRSLDNFSFGEDLEVAIEESITVEPSNDKRANKPENIRFFMLCEQPYETHVSSFKICQDSLNAWIKGPYGSKSLLKHFSLYGYSTRKSQGVLVRGQFGATAYAESSRALTNLVNAFTSAGLTTTTFIVSETIMHGRDRVIERRIERIGGDWRHISSNLLSSLESHPEFYLSSQEMAYEGPAVLATTKEEQMERCRRLDAYCENKLLDSLKHYHNNWWETLEELRLLYRWVVAGSPKSDQLIAVMMKGYADMEAVLGRLLRACGTNFSFFAGRKKKLLRELQEGPLTGIEAKKIEDAINLIIPEKVGETLTLEPICIEMGKIKTNPLFKQFSDTKRTVWSRFVQTLRDGTKDRNDLMHGNVNDMFAEIDNSQNSGNDDGVFAWSRFVINYMHLRVLYPIVRSMFEAYIEQINEESK